MLYMFDFFFWFLASKRFDVSGAGACLKRYTDPSFFKMESASSGLATVEVNKEKKNHKIKVPKFLYSVLPFINMILMENCFKWKNLLFLLIKLSDWLHTVVLMGISLQMFN